MKMPSRQMYTQTSAARATELRNTELKSGLLRQQLVPQKKSQDPAYSGLHEAQAGIKIARRNINNFRYADDTTLMAESEELKSLLMKSERGE